MVKIESNTKTPSKFILYWRYADEVYSRQKLGGNVLFERLKSYHSNIKVAIALNPSNFVDAMVISISGA